MTVRVHIPALLCSVVAIALMSPGVARGQAFVTASGGEFQLCGQTFDFVGFNVRGICHFGRGDVLPYSNTADIATNLDYCVSAKARVIRLFCAYSGIGEVETGNRLQAVLDACAARDMYAIVALTDMYQNTAMHPQGDDVYYSDYGSYRMLNHNFFAGGYTANYLPQTLYLANRFKDHPAVFAWQLGNEIRDLSSGSTFVTFCQSVAAQIRAVDPNHLISAGLIGYRQSNISYNQAVQLYGSLDFVGTHNYHGSDYDNDSAVANALNQPYVIDEAGFPYDTYGPDRTPETNADIVKWRGRGADGYMNWALMATGYDNGDGDRYVGVDPVFHGGDFYLYRNLYNTWGTSFEMPAGITVTPLALEQTVAAGQAPQNDVITVYSSSASSQPFVLDLPVSVGWVSASPLEGQATCAGTPILVQYDLGQLAPGTHSTTIEIDAGGIQGSPAFVTITLTLVGVPGDFDGDHDVDQEDYGRFQACVSGQAIPQTDEACGPAHFDGDPDVDADDVEAFLGCMSGADIPAALNCNAS